MASKHRANDSSNLRPQSHSSSHKLSQRLTAETIVTRYEAGEPSTSLMKAFNLSKGSVLKVLREAGATMRNQGLSQEQISEAQRLYEETEWSLARIGEKFNVDHGTVWRQLVKRGVRIRDTHGRER
jgi:hypothetical protein